MKNTKLAFSALRTVTPRSASAHSFVFPKLEHILCLSIATPRDRAHSREQYVLTQHRRFSRSANPNVSRFRAYASKAGPNNPETNASTPEGGLRRTALHDLHVERGGKMVPFGGFSMPVQYADLSIGESHRWTREKASLFDVGHMVQHQISGPGATAFLEKITPSSLGNLEANRSTLSCLLHPFTGGIVDDTVITRLGPQIFYIVTNAANRKKDIAYLEEQLKNHDPALGKVEWEVRDERGLIALQGPLSADVLKATLTFLRKDNIDLDSLYFGECISVFIHPTQLSEPVEILISRAGYTGEDGFEISIPPNYTRRFTERLLLEGGEGRVRLAGLGARDSLRLEAGMCLYGHDLDDTTTPVEAGLSWVIAKDRRDAGSFHGHETLSRQLKPAKAGGGVTRRRVGLIVEGAPAREGADILGPDGKSVGIVTSGCPSPTLGKNIAMGYVETGCHKAGTKLGVQVRGKKRDAEVVKLPFLPSQYRKKTGTAPA